MIDTCLIVVCLITSFIGSILFALVMNYSYRKGREEYIELEEYEDSRRK